MSDRTRGQFIAVVLLASAGIGVLRYLILEPILHRPVDSPRLWPAVAAVALATALGAFLHREGLGARAVVGTMVAVLSASLTGQVAPHLRLLVEELASGIPTSQTAWVRQFASSASSVADFLGANLQAGAGPAVAVLFGWLVSAAIAAVAREARQKPSE